MGWFPVLGLLVCLSVGLSEGGKILVTPTDGSHWLSMKILVKELMARGHELVLLIPENNLLIKDLQSFTTVIHKVPYTKEKLDRTFNALQEGVFKPPEFSDIKNNVDRLVAFTTLQVQGCEYLLNNKELMDQLRGSGFDAVLSDPFLPCGSVLAHMFSIPAVYFLRGLPCQLDMRANQCPSPPSYIPIFFSDNTDKMNFPQRVKNFLMYLLESYVCTVMYASFDDVVSRYISPGMTYENLLGEGAIWLLRHDFTFEWPRPIMPNMVFIGGINCVKKSPLPADLEEFVEGSGDDGFIVFTMGSMVSNMPPKIANFFFEAFAQIPQRVVWRYVGEVPENASKNVKLLKWLPQNDLLAHPKVRLFMTHGGTHGMYEGICNGVPMLMFPLFGDQRDNVNRMKARGVAEQLFVYDLNTEALLTALRKMINDKRYKENMQTLSDLHNDRPVQPLDLAVFWTEFVLRHKGADHLRVAAHDLNWIQYFCLDVMAFLTLIVLTVIGLTVKCCLFCTRKCCGRGTAVKKKQAYGRDQQMTVVLGAHNLTKKEKSQQRIPVEKSFPHPKYKEYDFDIKLLKLKRKAEIDQYVATMDLPKKDKNPRALKNCSVAGWGITDPLTRRPSDVLRVAEEQMQFIFECKNKWKDYFNSQHMICTKFDTKKGGSACQGDSGGPLSCNNKPLGITAFTGRNCGNSKYYHVYTKISSFLPWINKVMSGRGNVSKPLTLESQRSGHIEHIQKLIVN